MKPSKKSLRRAAAGLAVTGASAAAVLLPAGGPLAYGAVAKSSSSSGRIFTIAGVLRWTGPPEKTRLATATDMTVTALAPMPDGGFLVADNNDFYGYADVYRVWPNGRAARVAGGGRNDPAKGGPATQAEIQNPLGLAALPNGAFLIADTYAGVIERVSGTGQISVVAGGGQHRGDGGPATDASLNSPTGVVALPHGGFLIVDNGARDVREVSPKGIISTFPLKHPARPRYFDPYSASPLPGGGFLLAEQYGAKVWRVGPAGQMTLVAGGGHGRPRNGEPATKAYIGFLNSVSAIPGGGFLIGGDAPTIREVNRKGRISTVISTNNNPFPGDGGAVSHAQLYGPPSSAPAVVALPHGEMLIGYGNSVRLVVGTKGTQWLAAAIRPMTSYVSAHSYRARVELTHAADLTLRLYGLKAKRPIAVTHAHASAGASTITIHLPRRLSPGLYSVDLHAQNRHAVTRAEQWVYLGARLTGRSLKHIEAQQLLSGASYDPRMSLFVDVGPCRNFGSLRVDCVVNNSSFQLFVESMSLTPEGQLRARDYGYVRRHHSPFRDDPRWLDKPYWFDLGAAWAPYPTSCLC